MTSVVTSIVIVHEILHSPSQGSGDLWPADGREAFFSRDLDLDSVDDSAVARPVRPHVVAAGVVAIPSRAGEDGRWHDTVALVAQVVAETVGGRAADEVLEAGVVCGTKQTIWND